jgi:hypothetical protein
MKSVRKKKKFKIKPLRIAVNITGIISKSIATRETVITILTQLSDNQYILKKKQIIEILNTQGDTNDALLSC